MTTFIDKDIYSRAKKLADEIYKKHSAYKSGFIVKKYKELGGKFEGSKTKEGLTRWYKEEWKDIGNKQYPVYRPTKKINSKTPLRVNEINEENIKKQIKLKQKIKGTKNLPKFKPK